MQGFVWKFFMRHIYIFIHSFIHSFLPFAVAASYEGLQDMHKIMEIVKTQKKVGFLYLSPAVPKSSVHYHYYNLKWVPPPPSCLHLSLPPQLLPS